MPVGIDETHPDVLGRDSNRDGRPGHGGGLERHAASGQDMEPGPGERSPGPVVQDPESDYSAPGNRNAASEAGNVPPCAIWTTMYWCPSCV